MQYAKNFKFLQLNEKKVAREIHTVPFISQNSVYHIYICKVLNFLQ